MTPKERVEMVYEVVGLLKDKYHLNAAEEKEFLWSQIASLYGNEIMDRNMTKSQVLEDMDKQERIVIEFVDMMVQSGDKIKGVIDEARKNQTT